MSSTGRSHERIEELTSLDALGALGEDERAELAAAMAEHGDDCPECTELVVVYAEAVVALALALTPASPSAGAEERLIAAARARDLEPSADGGRPAREHAALTVLPGGRTERPVAEPATPAARPERRRWSGRWVAAAAVAAALVVGGVSGFVAAPRAPSGTKDFLAFAAQPGVRSAAFQASGGQRLSVVFRPGQTSAWVIGTGLDKPSGGRTYELWWGTKGTPLGSMHAAGVFIPIHGDVVAQVTVDASQPGTVLGVTIEPPGGSPEPTTAPIFVTTV